MAEAEVFLKPQGLRDLVLSIYCSEDNTNSHQFVI